MDHGDKQRRDTSGQEGGLETLNVRLPEEIIKLLDQLVERGLFANRSEAIREFMREYVLEERRGTARGEDAGGRRG